MNTSAAFLAMAARASIRDTTPLIMSAGTSRRTPPILHTPKMTRPPVISSMMSRSFSRMRKHCMNRLSNPKASAMRPSQSIWLDILAISDQMVRRYLALSGTWIPMSSSMPWQ